jgi:hypothetical protein
MYLVIIGAFVLIDYYFIEMEGNALNKSVMWAIRLAVTLSFAGIDKSFQLMEVLRYAFFLAFFFYALFDYSLNLARGKPFFHKGENWIDRLIPAGIPDLSFKIIGLFASYIVYQYDFFFCMRTGILESGFGDNVKICLNLMI